jgi:hypothetical protein
LFRPELLFVDKTVSESFPAGQSTGMVANSNATSPELTGMFHTVAHETKGTASIYRLANGQRASRSGSFQVSRLHDLVQTLQRQLRHRAVDKRDAERGVGGLITLTTPLSS